MSKYWRVEREIGNVVLLILDRPDKEVNTLSEGVLMELNSELDKLNGDNQVEGIVFLSGKKDFVVGADINEIAALTTVESATEGSKKMQAVFQKIANLKVPTVAAIHGQCLGGGLEMALACTWRLTTDDPRTKLALPEIQLGLIPGAGGTQRLPRVVGLQVALDLILTGKRVAGKKAEKIGLADACVPLQSLREQAVLYATRRKVPARKSSELAPSKVAKDLPRWATEGNPFGRKLMQKKAKEMVDDKTKGFYPASYKALDAVFESHDLPLAKGLELEANLFGQLSATKEARSLIHLFHATTHIKKNPCKEAGQERFGDKKNEMIGIIGAGFMGAGIACVSVDKGMKVRLSDPNPDSVGRALKNCRSYFQKKVDRRRMKTFELNQKMAMISPGLSAVGFKQCDLFIEAVFEDLSLKQRILSDLEARGNNDFIFATNTSALPIAKIAQTAKHPERVIGMHFFSPVEKMPLLEIVVTPQTADWVTARVFDAGQTMGKQVIVVKDGPGFYTTRCLSFFLNEAAQILLEGHAIDQIDQALTRFGFPVGPITLIDEVGIDVGIHVLETIQDAFPDRLKMPEAMQPIADSGRLGRKNNKGFYLYEHGRKTKPDHEIYELMGVKPGSGSLRKNEIAERCLLVFVNESVRCLEEGILNHPHDGDVGAVFGLGFPPFLGGPFKYVDQYGAKEICAKLADLATVHGKRFEPAALLVQYAEENRKFFPDEP